MKKTIIILASALALSAGAFAQDSKASIKFYGFIRNYMAFDTRESVSGTEDFFYYLPKDISKSAEGTDLNAQPHMSCAALTSRLGLDVAGYQLGDWKIGAKIEGDFYAGVSGVTGTAQFRLRQAFATISNGNVSFKAGQAWHPLAADMPDVFSLNTGSPFNPFSRTPLISVDYKFTDKFSITGAAIWQMQYVSAGPEGASANYIKYGCTPELYLGLNYTEGPVLARIGVDVLSIKPRHNNGVVKVSDRITTVSPYIYAQYKKDMLTVKFKTVFAQAGEHMNLNGGYGIAAMQSDGSAIYTPSRNSSTWATISYGKKLQGVLFAGYVKNLGTMKPLADGTNPGTPLGYYFSKNSFDNMNSMWRLTPTVIYNWGKVAFGLEWEITSVQYGEKKLGMDLSKGLYNQGLHWVTNNRLQTMIKYTF